VVTALSLLLMTLYWLVNILPTGNGNCANGGGVADDGRHGERWPSLSLKRNVCV